MTCLIARMRVRYIITQTDGVPRILSSWNKLREVDVPLEGRVDRHFHVGPSTSFSPFDSQRQDPYGTILQRHVQQLPRSLLHTSRIENMGKVRAPDSDGHAKRQEDKSPLIMLIDTDAKVAVVTLNQAYRMAKRRDLKVVKVEDPTVTGKLDKEVYKLMTGKQYFEEEVKAKKDIKTTSGTKGEKILTISGKIAANDLKSKIHNVEKWLKKGNQVKVTITSRGCTSEEMESVFSIIEADTSGFGGRILQRREKKGDLKFFIAPAKVEKELHNVVERTDNTKHETDTDNVDRQMEG